MSKFLALDKLKNALDIIKFHGGIVNSVVKMLRIDDLKVGKLVGVDKFGNKYFENDYFFVGRNRWVEYSDKFGYDYDGSCIPAEWFGWLHYKTDLIPSQDKSRPNYKWLGDYTENCTGTDKEYVPYSTTKPKIQAWIPPNLKK